MESAIVSEEAVLWLGGQALAEGPLSDCIKNWLGLPRGPRANSYIQLRKPMGHKSVFRPNELYRIAASELIERQH